MSSPAKLRMSAEQRRAQLIRVGRELFATQGLDGTTIEELAAAAGVTKPVIYEHFASKDRLYRQVVEHEAQRLLQDMAASLIPDDGAAEAPSQSPRYLVERAVLAMLTYIEQRSDGFRILMRDSAPAEPGGTYALLSNLIVDRVQRVLAKEFAQRGFQAGDSEAYAQMLVGMVARTGQWWMDQRSPSKERVAAQVVNLIWYGLTGLRPDPKLHSEEAS